MAEKLKLTYRRGPEWYDLKCTKTQEILSKSKMIRNAFMTSRSSLRFMLRVWKIGWEVEVDLPQSWPEWYDLKCTKTQEILSKSKMHDDWKLSLYVKEWDILSYLKYRNKCYEKFNVDTRFEEKIFCTYWSFKRSWEVLNVIVIYMKT